jgi:hypothetical protein
MNSYYSYSYFCVIIVIFHEICCVNSYYVVFDKFNSTLGSMQFVSWDPHDLVDLVSWLVVSTPPKNMTSSMSQWEG